MYKSAGELMKYRCAEAALDGVFNCVSACDWSFRDASISAFFDCMFNCVSLFSVPLLQMFTKYIKVSLLFL